MEDADFETGASDYDGGSHSSFEREAQVRQERSWNAGFVEGLEQTQGGLIQESFTRGFGEGSQVGFRLGAARGALAALRAKDMQPAGGPVDSRDSLGGRPQETAQPVASGNHPNGYQDPLSVAPFRRMHLRKGLILESAIIYHKYARSDGCQQQAQSDASFELCSSLDSSLQSLEHQGIRCPMTLVEIDVLQQQCLKPQHDNGACG